VLRNRFEAFEQDTRLVSGDRGEAAQETRLRLAWKSWRDAGGRPRRGVLSKTRVEYTHPFDLRFSGYLVVHNHERPSDQFVYLATSRRIRRVNLRREAVFGTDFTLEDIVPNELEDGDYERLPDEEVAGRPARVVKVTPKPHVESEYAHWVAAVDRESCVPLRTRYWDGRGNPVKELQAPAARIQRFGDVHWPMELTMRNLQLETWTTLSVEHLEPEAVLDDQRFDVRRLESH
jgi:hypothetical protein